MVDLEVVALADAAQDRSQDRLVHVIHALAADAHQVMVMFGNAGHVRGDVTGSLEPRRHPGFDLRLERAVDGGKTKAWMTAVQALVKLLRGHGLPLGGERLSDDDALLRKAPAARRDPLRERRPGSSSSHMRSIPANAHSFEYDSH